MVTFRFAKYGKLLVSRALGAQVREDLLAEIAKGEKLTLDFEGIEMVGNSFADECFGKILIIIPLDELRRVTTFRNLSGTSRVSVSAALRRRYYSLARAAIS